MKKQSLFGLLVVLYSTFNSPQAVAQTASLSPGTICIKDPAAENAAAYFSASSTYAFEVYKASAEDVSRIISSIKKDPAVETVIAGKLTGDYQAITISLKSAKNKDWFIKTFKNAGLNTIRINRHEVTPVDKI